MRACVRNAVDGRGEVGGGGVVDRVHADRLPADSRAQGVDERIAGRAGARFFGGAAGKHHLGVGTRVAVRGRHRRTLHRAHRQCRRADQSSDAAWTHRPMLTYREAWCALIRWSEDLTELRRTLVDRRPFAHTTGLLHRGLPELMITGFRH